jgi:hypothetical protein
VLTGRSVTLRQVREADLDVLYEAHTNIRNRGAYGPYPHQVAQQPHGTHRGRGGGGRGRWLAVRLHQAGALRTSKLNIMPASMCSGM